VSYFLPAGKALLGLSIFCHSNRIQFFPHILLTL